MIRGQSEGLLDEYMFAGHQCLRGHAEVSVGGSGDDNTVYRLSEGVAPIRGGIGVGKRGMAGREAIGGMVTDEGWSANDPGKVPGKNGTPIPISNQPKATHRVSGSHTVMRACNRR